jgi:hypothetical protein
VMDRNVMRFTDEQVGDLFLQYCEWYSIIIIGEMQSFLNKKYKTYYMC